MTDAAQALPAPETLAETKTLIDSLRVAELACKLILGQLATISDQRATPPRHEGQLVHGTSTVGLRTRDRQQLPVKTARYAESRIPDGVSNTIAAGDHAPSKQLSLLYHYRWRMAKAQKEHDAGQMLRLAGEATRDYEEHVGKRKPLRFSSHADAVAHLLSSFQGVPAETVAIEMRTPGESFRDALRWVQRQRAQNGCDPELGEPRVSDDRTKRIFALAEQGVKQRMIAEEIGVSQQRVSQVLAGRN